MTDDRWGGSRKGRKGRGHAGSPRSGDRGRPHVSRRAALRPPASDGERDLSADPAGLAPRRAALRLLDAVTGEGMLLSDPRAAGLLTALPPEGRARARRLALGVLRQMGRTDAWLARRLRSRPPLPVLNVLRLAAWELGSGEAPHGAVNAAVTILASAPRSAGYKGLANAVLRALAAEGAPAWAALPPGRLPDWLRSRLVAAWGEQTTAAIEAVQEQIPPIDLTARGDPAALAARLGGRLLPTGTVRIGSGRQVTALPGWHEGAFWVQDAAAALPVRLLGPRPGERVIDLCAAPGGKTLQLAAAGAEVTAVDLSAARLEMLRENLARTGLQARVILGDALEIRPQEWDGVLLDAPCSATGTMRRHPDLPRGPRRIGDRRHDRASGASARSCGRACPARGAARLCRLFVAARGRRGAVERLPRPPSGLRARTGGHLRG
ncbi:NusB family/NOL1/NOP2/sun family [Rubellimicrobium thermophilum DSM 16684]|uniref:NusB family/NOL1/NOP2/sun family n=1 Tax=Rubellimicrobium thermophilum DSM 16684 TaxID=1123069 RepID=S9QM43_9RHOB|nr:NusB family/NOL1/NOP2/sun family [Rubellimicrobium thermophilum DSM 16684]